MMPQSEPAARRERANAPGRPERIEMLAAIGSHWPGDCPNWVVMELEDCERASCAPALSEDGSAGDEER